MLEEEVEVPLFGGRGLMQGCSSILPKRSHHKKRKTKSAYVAFILFI